MSEFKVEKHVAIPDSIISDREQLYPFSEMEVGDSFQFPSERMPSVSNAAQAYKRKAKLKRNVSLQFAVRRVQIGTHRCWRIK
jgi:hypothetical protein